MTILTEFTEQVDSDAEPPTHVFLQAGVGSFSGEFVLSTQIILEPPLLNN